MSVDALPYTVLLLLFEGAIGHLVVTLATDARGLATRGLVRLGGAIGTIAAGLGLWLAFTLDFDGPVADYPLRSGFTDPIRGLAFAVAALTLAYTVATWRRRSRASFAVGALAGATALALLAVLSAALSLPAWGYPGVLLSLMAGSISLGLVSMSMSLGHWYLVTPRLPERPLRELTFALMVVIAFQSAVVVANLMAPGTEPMPSMAGLSIGENPALWLRMLVGLLFPVVLAYMAWRSSGERAMMSATGLLYIAMGAVMAGEVLARGLLFATAIPV